MEILIFKNEVHFSTYLNFLKGMMVSELLPPIRVDLNFRDIDFDVLKNRVGEWRPRGKCPLCFWNRQNLVLSNFIISTAPTGKKIITESYHKCPHYIYDLKYIDLNDENGVSKTRDERQMIINVRSQFNDIIFNWDNWVTHIKTKNGKK